jgi:OmpA-OmpF porin, OOP family
MTDRIFLLLLLMLAASLSPLQAQDHLSTRSKPAIRFYQEAEALIARRQFPEATLALQRALDKDPDFVEAHLRMGFCYEMLRNLPGQQYHLEQVVRLMPADNRYKNSYFVLGKVYFNRGMYRESAGMLDRLERLGMEQERIRREVASLRENIAFALVQLENPLQINPQPLPEPLNRFALQYFPVLTADEKTIFFTRRNGISFADDEDIYESNRQNDGTWSVPVSISPNINSRLNEGTCSISADGRTLIFTSCEGRQSFGSCDLYVSYRVGEEWSVPENLGPNINTRAWESQPSLSADGRELFFISDRTGGGGKRDIWMSRRDEKGQWMKAWNLGAPVNTPEDEVSPFIHANGAALFFASRGYPGMGGFDLFISDRMGLGWGVPRNLGYPINTHDDQVSLFISTDGKTGYYSFEQQQAGQAYNKSTLYYFNFPEDRIMVSPSQYLTGTIRDARTGENLKARIELWNLAQDSLINVFESDPVTGIYYSVINRDQRYGLYVEREGYLFESRSFALDSAFADAQAVQDFLLQPIERGAITRLNNIYFDFDSYALRSDSETELQKLRNLFARNPTMVVEIAGHTDNLGSDAYNHELSTRRAKAVYDYLVEHGVPAGAIAYRGYGETQPLVPNQDEESRQHNRRIEFRITE